MILLLGDAVAPTTEMAVPTEALIVQVFFLFFLLGTFVLGLATFVFWLWALIDCARKEHPGENMKLVWILVVLFAGIVGALIYFCVGRPKAYLPRPAPPG